MKHHFLFPRFAALFLSLSLSLPSPALALRTEEIRNNPQATAGLEQTLGHPAAGLEEILLSPEGEGAGTNYQELVKGLNNEFQALGSWRAVKASTEARRVLAGLSAQLAPYVKPKRWIAWFTGNLIHEAIDRNVFLELVRRPESEWPLILSALTKAKSRRILLSSETEEVLSRYDRGEASLAAVTDPQQLLALMILDFEQYASLGTLLEGLHREPLARRQEVVNAVRQAADRLARLSQWDFVHRFQGTSGIRLIRGIDPTSRERIVLDGTVIRLARFFSYEPGWAHVFGISSEDSPGGRIMVADVPVTSIRLSSWIFPYPSSSYELELAVEGPIRVREVFHYDQPGDFYRWLSLERGYRQQLASLRGLTQRDRYRISQGQRESRDDFNNWFRYLMTERLRQVVGGHPFPAFRGAVDRALGSTPYYRIAAQRIEKMLQAAKEMSPPQRVEFIQNHRFAAGPSTRPSDSLRTGLEEAGKRFDLLADEIKMHRPPTLPRFHKVVLTPKRIRRAPIQWSEQIKVSEVQGLQIGTSESGFMREKNLEPFFFATGPCTCMIIQDTQSRQTYYAHSSGSILTPLNETLSKAIRKFSGYGSRVVFFLGGHDLSTELEMYEKDLIGWQWLRDGIEDRQRLLDQAEAERFRIIQAFPDFVGIELITFFDPEKGHLFVEEKEAMPDVLWREKKAGEWLRSVEALSKEQTKSSSGLEERQVRETLSGLEEVTAGKGVVVMEAAVLENRPGMLEFASRIGPLARRLILVGLEEAEAKELKARNPLVQAIPKDDFTGLVVTLVGLEEADRITHVGTDPDLARRLSRVLPPSMKVIHVGPSTGLEEILLALGVADSFIQEIDAVGLEEQLSRLARQRAA